MNNFALFSIDTAPEASRPVLETAEKAFGFLPNMLKFLSQSPIALDAYFHLMGAMKTSTLSEGARQVVYLTVSRINGCSYCLPAHGKAAKGAGLDEEQIKALQTGDPLANEKLETLRQTVESLVHKKGALTDSEMDAFFSAGYTKEQLLDILAAIAAKVISNFGHQIGKFDLDEQFK